MQRCVPYVLFCSVHLERPRKAKQMRWSMAACLQFEGPKVLVGTRLSQAGP
jgi:hypothetical protein